MGETVEANTYFQHPYFLTLDVSSIDSSRRIRNVWGSLSKEEPRYWKAWSS
jgi:hypothetical protein